MLVFKIFHKNATNKQSNKIFIIHVRSVYKELHADRETGC